MQPAPRTEPLTASKWNEHGTMSDESPRRRALQPARRLRTGERYYERALDFYAKGALSDAIADMDQALAHSGRNAEYYAARGLMLVDYEAPDEAEQDFAHSLKLDIMQWLAHYGRGVSAFRASDFETAVAQFSRAQHVAPDRPEIYIYRGVAFFVLDQRAEAAQDLRFAQGLLNAKDKRQALIKKWLAELDNTRKP